MKWPVLLHLQEEDEMEAGTQRTFSFLWHQSWPPAHGATKSPLLVHPLWRWLHSYSQRCTSWVISKSSQATMESNPHTYHDLHCWMHIRCPSLHLHLEFPLPPFKTPPLLLSLFMSLCLPWSSARFKTMVWYTNIIILFNKKRIFTLMSCQKMSSDCFKSESKCHKA